MKVLPSDTEMSPLHCGNAEPAWLPAQLDYMP